MKLFHIMLLSALAGLLPLGAGKIPGENELVFRYVPSDEPALAEMGGSVLGTYLPGNMELAEENGRKVLRFRNPGSGALTFPLTGNLTHAEGTLLMDIAYDFDPAEVHAAVQKAGKWSRQFFLFRADKDGKGVALYLDIISKSKPGNITVGVMAAGKQHQWNYVSALRNETALPRGQRCTIGFTWKRNRFAIIVNDTVFPEADVGRPPAWGPTFHFGGAGTFPGRLYEVRAYCKSAL